MKAQFPHRRFEYQLWLGETLDEARGCDDREVFDMECSDLIDVLLKDDKLALFENGEHVATWEIENDGLPECVYVKEN